MWKMSMKIKVNPSKKEFHLNFLDYLMSDAWTKIKGSSSSLNNSMDNVMEGIKRLVTEENEFQSRVKPKTTQFFVFFWTYWNLMQQTISKIAQLIRHLPVRGSCLKPWWMKTTFHLGSIQETWTKKFPADATKHLIFQSFCSPERKTFWLRPSWEENSVLLRKTVSFRTRSFFTNSLFSEYQHSDAKEIFDDFLFGWFPTA